MKRFSSLMLSAILLGAPATPALAAGSPVVVEGDRLIIPGKVLFVSGDADVGRNPNNAVLLRALADAILADGQIDKLVIEGHTDSAGDSTANRTLSRRRADAVREALIALGVPGARLESRGFGDSVPVATNDTAAGREKNRRVEFMVLVRAGQLTASASPLAHIAARFNKVGARPPEEPKWGDGKVGLPLFRAWRVNTEQQSSADVAFRNQSRVHLRERTLIVIFGSDAYEKKEQRRATLESGTLVSRLDELLGGGPLEVESPAGDVELGRGRAVVNVRPAEKMTRISNHSGDKAKVRGRTGKKKQDEVAVTVAAGMGTRVATGRVPEPPRPLPPAPRLDPAAPATIRYDGDESVLRFGWTAETISSTVLEIRRADGDGGVVFQAETPAEVRDVEARGLPPGVYAITLSVTDAAGLESRPMTTGLTIGPRPPEVVRTPITPTPHREAKTQQGGASADNSPQAVDGAVVPASEADEPGLCSGVVCPMVLAGGVVLVVGAVVTGLVVAGEIAR